MNYFRRILIFSGLPLILIIISELIARIYYPAHSDLPIKYRYFSRNCNTVECLVSGHSHAEKGIDPNQLSMKVFNLAFSAQDLYYTCKTIQKYMSDLPGLNTIIIAIDPFIFRYNEQNSSPYFVKDYFFYEGIWPQNGIDFSFLLNSSVLWLNRGNILKDIVNRDFQEKSIKIYSKVKFPDHPAEGQYLTVDGQRIAVGKMDDQSLVKDAESTIRRIMQHQDSTVIMKNYKYLKKMIQLSREKGINVILIYMPVTSYYEDLIPQYIKFEAANLINSLIKSNGNVTFYDFSNCFRENTEYFYNSDHLNYTGALHFSEMLDPFLMKSQ